MERRRTITDLVARARSRYRRLSPTEAHAEARNGAIVVDTRCREALDADGRIPGALHVPLSVLPWRVDPDSVHRDERIARLDARLVLVCAHGYSSSLAVASLLDLGFSAVTDIDGGFEAWSDAGLPVTLAEG
ncbi:MAG: rhodanese-like domain-containing protein [Chloroflexota bacterium]|nr:rhodanese-like domain-containing protein [Chloroflexota bacterium]